MKRNKAMSRFVPLFPLLWRYSCLSGWGIALINYFTFGLAISYLWSALKLRKDFSTLSCCSKFIIHLCALYGTAFCYLPFIKDKIKTGILMGRVMLYWILFLYRGVLNTWISFLPATTFIVIYLLIISGRLEFRVLY